jgi:hypothetical protein
LALRAVPPRKPAIAVLAGEIPAPALEARLGVLAAVISTRTGRVARETRAHAGPESGLLTWPRQAVEVIYEPDRIEVAQLEEASGGEAVDAAGFDADAVVDQKPYLRRAEAFHRHLARVYPDPSIRTLSTAATRLNGYLAGYGTVASLDAELDSLGLPQPLEEALRSRVYPQSVPRIDRT